MRLFLKPIAAFYVLLLFVLALLLGNIFAIWTWYNTEDPVFRGFARLFDFDREANIPSFISGLLLLLSSLLLRVIYRHHLDKDLRNGRRWLILAFVFLFLSIDEFTSLHESLMALIRSYTTTSGYFHFAWVIPYGLAVMALGLAYLPFLKRLPQRTAGLMILSGVLYVGGALGMELLSGQHVSENGRSNLLFSILYTIEETLELVGVSLFIYTLLDYLSGLVANSEIHIRLTR